MKVRIRTISRDGIISEFIINGEVTIDTGGSLAQPKDVTSHLSVHLFRMEYAINEHVPDLRCHIELSDE